jgi:hypothetical protein
MRQGVWPARLFFFHAGFVDDLSPFSGFGGLEFRQFIRRGDKDFGAAGRIESAVRGRALRSPGEQFIETGNDCRRRFCRRIGGEPITDVIPFNARFFAGRDLWRTFSGMMRLSIPWKRRTWCALS